MEMNIKSVTKLSWKNIKVNNAPNHGIQTAIRVCQIKNFRFSVRRGSNRSLSNPNSQLTAYKNAR